MKKYDLVKRTAEIKYKDRKEIEIRLPQSHWL